jgi:GNAT superfamily N-acetyltransferase
MSGARSPCPVLSAGAIEALERATVQAVSPQQVFELPGWLVPVDPGTVGRARSAVPLHHGPPDLARVPEVLALYAAQGATPRWRLPDGPTVEALHRDLGTRGFVRTQPTLTQVAPVASLIAATDALGVPAGVEVALAPQASAAWTALFLGADFDPVDGAHRAQALARAPGTQFASAVVDGVVVACGALSLSQGWAGVHGMRTVGAWRGRGLAAALVRRMAQQAQAAGVARVFLQVDAGNTGAQSLYRRLGFETVWTYAYWRPA